MNILIAEDDLTSRVVLGGQLRKLGHSVIETADGQEAIEAFHRDRPQVVVTDLMMPRKSGLDLCREIRDAVTDKYVYVIILTGLDARSAFLDGMKAGADDFVVKPCDLLGLTVRLRVAERIIGLQHEVTQLEGLLPICERCKKILDESEGWQQVEVYIGKKTETQFSHGVCPECYQTILKPQLEEIKRVRG